MYQHAPSFDLFGSFFPVWTVCLGAGLLLTVLVRFLIVQARLDDALAPRILVYPGLVTLFSCAIWLFFFDY